MSVYLTHFVKNVRRMHCSFTICTKRSARHFTSDSNSRNLTSRRYELRTCQEAQYGLVRQYGCRARQCRHLLACAVAILFAAKWNSFFFRGLYREHRFSSNAPRWYRSSRGRFSDICNPILRASKSANVLFSKLDTGRVDRFIAALKPYRDRSEAVAACIRTY